jgi:hypothetical protein
VTDNHDAMPGSECGQGATLQAFDGDVKQAHLTQTMLHARDQ